MAAKTYSFSAKKRTDHELIEALQAQAAASGRSFSFYVLQGLHLLKEKEQADASRK